MSRLSTALAALCTILFGFYPSPAQETKLDPPADIIPGRLIKEVRPVYPGIAATQGLDGDVVLRVTIAKYGTVHDIKVVHGLPQLINSAVHAVSQWQYEPARANGVAVPVSVIVHVHFQFGDQNAVPISPPQAAQSMQSTVTKPSLPPLPAGALRVSGRVMRQLVVTRIEPVYPAEAIPLDAKGDVLVVALVSQTGEVQEVQPISGPEMFRRAAIDAVKQWRFTPYLNEGQAVSVQTTVNLHFERPK